MKNIKQQIYYAALLLVAGFSMQYAQAQIKDSLYSHILEQNRQLEIILPQGGLQAGKKYDVFYVLDGEWNKTLVREITDFLAGEGLMPPQIIVGVLNGEPNMRDRDFTPTHVGDITSSGKADDFIRFLKKELRPYIDRNYPVSGLNLLFGHSFAGLFGMYMLIKEPGLFSSYILGDPSFWWDNHYIFPLTVSSLSLHGSAAVSLFILGRKGNGYQQSDAEGIDSMLKSMASVPSLNWEVISSPGETHTSTKLRALVEGLRFIYKGYVGSPLLVNPTSGGIVLQDQPFTIYCYDNYIEPFHFNINDSLPTENSKTLLYANQISLNHSADLNIMSITTQPALAQRIKEHFEVGSLIKAEKTIGTWTNDRAFNLDQVHVNSEGWKTINAYLKITETGYYDLQVSGSSAIRWYMGKKLVMTADSAAANGHFQSVIVPLETGFYLIHIEVKGQFPGKDAVLLYNTPASKGNGILLLPELLYRKTDKKNK